MEKQINSEMVQVARESRGLTQQELACRSGISQGFISKFEKSQKGITDEQLKNIGMALDYPVSFFYQKGNIYGFSINSVYHRKRKTIPVHTLKQIQAEISVFIIVLSNLLNGIEYNAPKQFCQFDIDDYDGDAEHIAHLVRSYWEIPMGPVKNVVSLIEQAMGIVILYDFGGASYDAESRWLHDKGFPPFFFMNKNIPPDRMRFTLAHELGHIVMHRIPNPDMEKQANVFAAELLMPRDEIIDDLSPFSFKKLGVLKMEWKVSMAALARRAFDLNVIDEDQYRKTCQLFSSYGYRRQEPVDIEEEKPQLMKRIIEIYRGGNGYSDKQLQDMLCLNESDYQRKILQTPFRLVS